MRAVHAFHGKITKILRQQKVRDDVESWIHIGSIWSPPKFPISISIGTQKDKPVNDARKN